jgi:hypothetical protein
LRRPAAGRAGKLKEASTPIAAESRNQIQDISASLAFHENHDAIEIFGRGKLVLFLHE